MSWQGTVAKWLGLFIIGKLLPKLYAWAKTFFGKKSQDFVAFQMLSEYQTVLWLHRKPERFYRYAFESVLGALKMLAWAGGWAAIGFIAYQIVPPGRAKDNLIGWIMVIVIVILSFMSTRCRLVELTAERLNKFDSYRDMVPTELVKQAEEDPRLK